MTSTNQTMIAALAPLAAVADAFTAGRLECERPGGDRPAEMIEIYQGRGGKELLNLRDVLAAREALKGRASVAEALAPLARIADAWDANELDDEARKFWGMNLEFENAADPADIPLVTCGGGGILLSLAHALEARTVLHGLAQAA